MNNISFAVFLSFLFIMTDAFAGNVRGPQTHYDMVMAKSTDSYSLVFEAEKMANIVVRGDTSTDLDCFVYDGNGNLVESDTDSTDFCSLIWFPSWEGKFTLQIRNHGFEPNAYMLRTN